MSETKVLFKKSCKSAPSDTVRVKQYMIVSDADGVKSLVVRLINDRNEPVTGITLAVEQFDGRGRRIARSDTYVDVYGAAGGTFVTDRPIALAEACVECTVTVSSADYGKYIYGTAADGSAKVKYIGDRDLSDEAVPVATGGKTGATVTARKQSVPVLVIIGLLVALIFAGVAVYLHLRYFVEHERTFLYSGVEYEFENDDRSDGTNIYVVGYYGNRSRVVIPKSIEGHPVNGVKEGAFRNNKSLVSLGFESDIPIEAYAFENCTALKSVDLSAITDIGIGAFSGCEKLGSVTINPDIDVIRTDTFYGCRSLTSVTVEEGENSIKIGKNAFGACTSLKTVDFMRVIDYTYGNSIAYFTDSRIGYLHLLDFDAAQDGAWIAHLFGTSGNARIERLEIDRLDKITDSLCQTVDLTAFEVKTLADARIGNYAFYGCDSLKDFRIPVSATSVGDYAFYGTAITAFDGSMLEELDDHAFGECAQLTGFTIADNDVITHIGLGAFDGCKSLAKFTVPANVTAIDAYTFRGCSAMTSIKFAPDAVIYEIADNAFNGCSSLAAFDIPGDECMYIGPFAFAGCKAFTEFTVPTSVTTIADCAFAGCTGLEEFTVPDSVLYIGSAAFTACTGLKELTVPYIGGSENGDNGYLSYIFGATSVYESASVVPASLKTVTVSKSCAVRNYAFNGFGKIEVINLPEVLTDTAIGDYAFNDCLSLKSIVLPSNATSIGVCAFNACTSLTWLAVPETVTSIGYGAFAGCKNLNKMSVPFIGGSDTGGDNNYLGYVFGANSFNYGAQYIPEALKTVTVTNASTIGDNAFYDCEYIEQIALPDGLSRVGYYAFKGCKNLTELTVPSSVTYIGYAAFYGCNGLTELSVPFFGTDNPTGIGESNTSQYSFNVMFGYEPPSSLKSVTLTNTRYVPSCAFYGLNHVERLTVDCDLAEVDPSAFVYCHKLYEIYDLGSGVKLLSRYDEAQYGAISTTVLAVHTDADDEPLYRETSSGYVFVVDPKDNLHMIDCPSETSVINFPRTATVGGKTYTQYAVWQYLFYCNTYVTDVSIPSCVTEIGRYAFAESAVKNVVFAADSPVTTIETGMFSYCYALDSIVLPSDLEYIESNAFSYCRKLKIVTLPETLTGIGNLAFAGCYRLFEVVNLSSRLNVQPQTIDNGMVAFYAAKVYGNSSAQFIPSVKDNDVLYMKLEKDGVDWWAVDFYGDTKLSILPFAYNGSTVKEIAVYDYAFSDIGYVTELTISNAVSMIDRQFSGFYDLERVKLVGGGDGTISIAEGAFRDKSALKSFISDVEISSIGDNAFTGCNSLTTVKLGNVGSIGNEAFYGDAVSALTLGTVNSIGERVFYGNALTALTLGNVGSMGDQAFGSNYSLKSATLGKVGTVGCYVFDECYALSSVAFTGDVATVSDYAFYNRSLSSVTFGGKVGTVGAYAFSDNYTLKEVTFASDVGTIGNHAFYACNSLLNIEFGGKLNVIDRYAFANCTALFEIVLPSGLTSIAEYAFIGCDGLRRVELPSTVTTISNTAFSGLRYILAVYNPTGKDLSDVFDGAMITSVKADSAVELGTYNYYFEFAKISGEWYLYRIVGNYNVILPESVTINGENVTGYNIRVYAASTAYLYTVVVPKSVKSIALGAFNGSTEIYYEGTAAELKTLFGGTLPDNNVRYLKQCLHGGEYDYSDYTGTDGWRYTEYGSPTTMATEFADSDWKTVVEPTCTETGVAETVCPYCKKTFKRAVGLIPHDFADGKCTVCGIRQTVVTEDNADKLGVATIDMTSAFEFTGGEIEYSSRVVYGSNTVTFTADADITLEFTLDISLYYGEAYVEYDGNVQSYKYTERITFSYMLYAGETVVIRVKRTQYNSTDSFKIQNITLTYTEEDAQDNA